MHSVKMKYLAAALLAIGLFYALAPHSWHNAIVPQAYKYKVPHAYHVLFGVACLAGAAFILTR
jgi:hypothetical protein